MCYKQAHKNDFLWNIYFFYHAIGINLPYLTLSAYRFVFFYLSPNIQILVDHKNYLI